MSRNRDWCLTWNGMNATAFQAVIEEQEAHVPGSVEYAIGQNEVAPTTGTEHLQGFIQMSSPRGLLFMKKLFPGGHLEKRKGLAQIARDYCNKALSEDGSDEPAWEWGTLKLPHQGQRNDIIAFKDAIVEGADDEVGPARLYALGGAVLGESTLLVRWRTYTHYFLRTEVDERLLCDVDALRVHGRQGARYYQEETSDTSHR